MLLSNGKLQEIDCQLEHGNGYAALGRDYQLPVRAPMGHARHGMVLSCPLLMVAWRQGRYHCMGKRDKQS